MEKMITKYCLSKIGARHDFKEEWDADRFLIRDKMFGMVGDNKEGRHIFTVKLTPENGDFLRTTYPESVIAGYYMNKVHWNSIYLDNPLNEEMMKKLIDEAHRLILESFSKKEQAEILDGE